MSAIPQTSAPRPLIFQNNLSSSGQMVWSAKKVALLALGALALLANFLWLPFKVALFVSLVEVVLISSCKNLHSDPPASVLPIPILRDPEPSPPRTIRSTVTPVVFEVPRREPLFLRPIAPLIPKPPAVILNSRPREQVGDGHLNRSVPAPIAPLPQIIHPHPQEQMGGIHSVRSVPVPIAPVRIALPPDSRPREQVGDGHLNRIVPPPIVLPPRTIDQRPREQVGGGHSHHREAASIPPRVPRVRVMESRPREQVGAGHRITEPLNRPDTPRPPIHLNASQGLAPLREPVGNRNPK